ncbi:MAG: hypothetical protein ACTMII_12130 [Brachybacterium sp.]|uniref:hypothetical protein n=1 Tax=unclassified Brachybacterium TaxID=2623841 RepID=UPI003F9E64B0
MTQPASVPSTPTPGAPPVGVRTGGRAEAPLRQPALAVTVLAGAVILTGVIELLLLPLQGPFEAMQYVVQGFYLVMVPVSLAFSASVLWLLAASGNARVDERRLSRQPLLMLGLLVLSALVFPAGQLLALFLRMLGVGDDTAVGYGLRTAIGNLFTSGGTMLLTAIIGMLALLLLRRPHRAEQTHRIPVGPVPVAVVLLITALLLAGIVPLQNLGPQWAALDWEVLQALHSLLTVAKGLLAALLVLTMGLLLALTAGRTRKVLWAGFIAYWVTQLLTVVLIRAFVFQMLSGAAAGGDWFTPVAGMVDVLGTLLLAATSVVVIVLLARRSQIPRS